MNKIKKGLGRGLSSLIGETKVENKTNNLSLAEIVPNKYQPRVNFDENNLFPMDSKSISLSILKKIRSNISEALTYYVFEDETTWAHLRLMLNKIDSVLDAQMMVR